MGEIIALDTLTPEQEKANKAATEILTPGKHYIFDPPVVATAIPVSGKDSWQPREMSFNRGWYLGFVKGKHVFQGKPLENPADIPLNLRESYFHVDFIGGSACLPDSDQTGK